jgi:uncharacterized protein YbjT (DUF2867 family)
MNILITGASGMVGQLVEAKCLQHPDINQVHSVLRRSSGRSHAKLTEHIREDFNHWQDMHDTLANIDQVIFCLGAYTGSLPDDQFKAVTVDMPLQLGSQLLKANPNAGFILLSGQGADTKETSRVAFAKYKGMAENQLMALGLGDFHSVRPSYIYPDEPRIEPNIAYRIYRIIYPLIKRLGNNFSVSSSHLAAVMVHLALHGDRRTILENKDIVSLRIND